MPGSGTCVPLVELELDDEDELELELDDEELLELVQPDVEPPQLQPPPQAKAGEAIARLPIAAAVKIADLRSIGDPLSLEMVTAIRSKGRAKRAIAGKVLVNASAGDIGL